MASQRSIGVSCSSCIICGLSGPHWPIWSQYGTRQSGPPILQSRSIATFPGNWVVLILSCMSSSVSIILKGWNNFWSLTILTSFYHRNVLNTWSKLNLLGDSCQIQYKFNEIIEYKNVRCAICAKRMESDIPECTEIRTIFFFFENLKTSENLNQCTDFLQIEYQPCMSNTSLT